MKGPVIKSEREKAMDYYGKELGESIERGEEDVKAGRVTRIKGIKNIWESILQKNPFNEIKL